MTPVPPAVVRLRNSAHELAIAVTHVPDLLLRRRIIDGHAHKLSMQEISAVLHDAARHSAIPPSWVATEFVPTVSDVAVLQVGEPHHPFVAYLKLARSAAAADGLLAQSRTLSQLHANADLQEWAKLLPRVITRGEYGGNPYIIEAAVSGTPVASLVGKKSWQPALRGAIADIRTLHSVTGATQLVDEELLSRWVDPPLQVLAELSTSWSKDQHFAMIELVRRRLQRGLLGRSVWISHTHGDFSPNNVLADAASGRITGILDWDRSQPDRPAFLDVAQFVIGAEHVAKKAHLGVVVRQMCNDVDSSSSELALLDEFWASHPGDRVSNSVVALLTLLHHVQSNVDKAPRYASHRLWVYRTVESVLGNLGE